MSGTATYRDDHPEDETRAWELLSERVGELVSAWEEGGDPPNLADFIPNERPSIQRLALAELIKVDLEYRWQHRGIPKMLEDYAVEFPEFSRDGLPADLIYEEYHVRKQSGDTVRVDDYFDRFPTQADELRRLMGIEGRTISTALFSGEKADPVEVGDRVDDFDLLARLGKGAFATVFLARQRSMQRLVALKVSANRGAEPQTMAQLDHPHIVRVFDQRLVPEKKMRLLYMQYVAGGTLQPVVDLIRQLPASERNGKAFLKVIDGCLERRGESPPAESSTRQRLARANWPEVVCWLGARMAAALDYAHRQGVLHRDVKPANILVAADGTPKLADFNISCSTKVEGATPAAYFGGSLAYMSPEQLEACNPQHDRIPDELDGQSDVYSLGVLLWELLCGRRPFADEPSKGGWPQTLGSMVTRRREGVSAEAIALMPPDLPAGLKEVLLQSLASDKSERYESAGELSRQLQLCLRPQVQQLLRPSGSPWRAAVRRHPIIALGIAGAVPNVVMSVVNIRYNHDAIDAFPVLQRSDIWNSNLVIVNALLYSTATAVALALAWPAIRAVLRLRRGDPTDSSLLPALRRHCLAIGDILFFVAMATWIASGIIFPTWIRFRVGPDSGFSAFEYFLHFGVSQVLCGLIAATLGFFAVAFVAVRAMYPALVRPDSTEDSDLESLARLSRRVWRYFVLSVAAPLLTIGVLAIAVSVEANNPDPANANPAQAWASAVTAGLGLVGFLIAFALARAIQSDLAALALAVSPSIDPLAEGSQSLESFLSGSR